MVKKKAYIVIGLGFGDEGKGLATDFLCLKNDQSIVVKFTGGHQSAHRVITKEGNSHIFSHFGAGSFRNVPTYRSRYCTFEPVSFINEFNSFKNNPTFYIDEECSITTYYDVIFNQAVEISNDAKRIGSSGSGYRTTIERQKHFKEKLLFRELFDKDIFVKKLDKIKAYYQYRTNTETAFVFESLNHERGLNDYLRAIEELKVLVQNRSVIQVREQDIFQSNRWNTYIFEGSQGILLDQNYGTKPYVTLSNTTSKNAHDILERYNELFFSKTIFYVTRAYQTRHGLGPFRKKSSNFFLINNDDESNQTNKFQGELKTNFLDIDQVNYALDCDNIYSKGVEKCLIITCVDHLPSEMTCIYENDKKIEIHFKDIPGKMKYDFKNTFYSFSGCAEFLNEA